MVGLLLGDCAFIVVWKNQNKNKKFLESSEVNHLQINFYFCLFTCSTQKEATKYNRKTESALIERNFIWHWPGRSIFIKTCTDLNNHKSYLEIHKIGKMWLYAELKWASNIKESVCLLEFRESPGKVLKTPGNGPVSPEKSWNLYWY